MNAKLRRILRDPMIWSQGALLCFYIGAPTYVAWTTDWSPGFWRAVPLFMNDLLYYFVGVIAAIFGTLALAAALLYGHRRHRMRAEAQMIARIKAGTQAYAVMRPPIADKVWEETVIRLPTAVRRAADVTGATWLTALSRETTYHFDDEIRAWIADNLVSGYQIHRGCLNGDRYVTFAQIEDAFTFKMRWS